MEHALPDLDPRRFPNLAGIERPFFEYWWRHQVRPNDPQKWKWVAYEEEQPSTVRSYVRELEKAIDLDGAKVLDVGCQNGATLVALGRAGAEPWGVELDERAARAAELRVRCHGIDANISVESACAMSFSDGAFDAVLASNVIEHVEDPRALLSECARVLRPGGTLYIDGPNRFSPRWLRADPHYQLAWVSILPGAWARAYAMRVRGLPGYDAETFPTARSTRRRLTQLGFALHDATDPKSTGLLANFVPIFHFLAHKKS